MFVTDHFGVNAGNINVSWSIETAPGDVYWGTFSLVVHSLNDRFLRE